jgi:uncharacterized membrane protein YpjA
MIHLELSMTWLSAQIQRLQRFAALPSILTTIIVIDVAAYFGGLLYWYGIVMARPTTPAWAWPFIPDCPLFGLLGGLGLLMVTAHKFWSHAAQAHTQRVLVVVGGGLALLWLSTYVPGVTTGWAMQRSMLAVCAWVVLLASALFLRTPAWLLTLMACGQIKYGVWTITAWLLFWRNTAAEFGSPLFTPDSVFMTITHIGLLAQGIFLLTYFKPSWTAALVSFGWFALSDFVDYALGWYPSLPLRYIPLPIMQWSTIAMTFVLGGLTLWLSQRSSASPDPGARNEPRSLAQPSV